MALSISKLFINAGVAFAAPAVLALAVSACSSDDQAAIPPLDGGGTGGGSSGGASTGGAKNTGGSKNTGGVANTGGTTSTGGAKATGGTAGTGGVAAGGTGGATTGGGPSTGGTEAGAGGTEAGAGGTEAGTGGTEAGADACLPLSLTRPTVSAAIDVPAGATAVYHYEGVGTQNYTCLGTATSDGGMTYAWSTASVPEANLMQGTCAVGTHYAGPTWKYTADGSTVGGTKVAAEAHSGTIPWLLLKGTSHSGSGRFSTITFIERLNTTGGTSPTDACDSGNVNAVEKVPYTADYYFFEGGVGDGGP